MCNLQTRKISNEDLFIFNSEGKRNNLIRKRVLEDGLIEYKCSICGINTHQGKEIRLDLDHIDGIYYNNELENLRFLCPNCHCQTDTYGGKNTKNERTKLLKSLHKMEKEFAEHISRVRSKGSLSKNKHQEYNLYGKENKKILHEKCTICLKNHLHEGFDSVLQKCNDGIDRSNDFVSVDMGKYCDSCWSKEKYNTQATEKMFKEITRIDNLLFPQD